MDEFILWSGDIPQDLKDLFLESGDLRVVNFSAEDIVSLPVIDSDDVVVDVHGVDDIELVVG